MNFFEAQEFIKKMNPGKEVKFDFDERCIRVIELVFYEGLPNPIHHIEYNQCKALLDGQEPIYVPIAPHRMNCDLDYVKKLIGQ